MKKNLFLSLLILLSISGMSQSFKNIYGGVSLVGFDTKDFVTFDISDWEKYGLYSIDHNSREGRVRVDLEDSKPDKTSFGVFLGATYEFTEKFSAIGDLQYCFSGIDLKTVNLGVMYTFIDRGIFQLGLSPRLGYNMGSVTLGTIELINGYTPPVVLSEGTFNVGDSLSIEFKGFSASIGLTPIIGVTNVLSIIGFIGYNYSLAKSEGLLCRGIPIPMDSNGIVKANGLSEAAEITPEVNSNGLRFSIGITYSLNQCP